MNYNVSEQKMFIVFIVLTFFDVHANVLDCRVSVDHLFGGSFVDCSYRNLSIQDLSHLHTDDVTTLVVTGNKFNILPNNSFIQFIHLRRLVCQYCDLDKVMINALNGLSRLESLHLDHNYLSISQHAFPRGFFSHIPHLKKLYIDNNNNTGGPARRGYSEFIDIFNSLPELTDLAIDSFHNLVIGEEFLNLTKLTSLKITCHSLRVITNDSLEGFQKSTVKRFELSRGFVFESQIGLDVFQYLPNVSYLSLDTLRIGNQNALRMMKPLVGREINTISWTTLYSPYSGSLWQKIQDGIMTVKSLQYIGNICVSNLFWYDSRIISLDEEAVVSRTWQRCLLTVVLQNDELIYTNNHFLFFIAKFLKKLEIFSYLHKGDGMQNQLIPHYKGIEYMDEHRLPFITNSQNMIDPNQIDQNEDANENDYNEYDIRYQPIKEQLFALDRRKHQFITDITSTFHKVKNTESRPMKSNFSNSRQNGNTLDTNAYYMDNSYQDLPKDFLHPNANMISKDVKLNHSFGGGVGVTKMIALPPLCKMIVIDGMHYIKISGVTRFKENKLRTVIASNGIMTLELLGKLYGLDALTTINLQGTKIKLAVDFFDTFVNLKNLVLNKTIDWPEFLQDNCKRIVEKLDNLESLDIAENGLQILATGTFHTSKRLKRLGLAKNRLSIIPFNLKLTSKLEVLDLRGNLFVDLSTEDRASIDEHILVQPHFIVLFNNNELSCTCAALPFLKWLQFRFSHFDNNGNYTCISEDGSLSYTALYRDVRGFWRKCEGRYFFMLSLILVCGLIAGYLAVFLGMKNKTQIVSKVMHLFVPGFRLKTRKDFSLDVCLGYADQEGLYVRNVLLRYLEDKWHLRTFVHQRDLRQDPLEMSNAIRGSWRCLLLVSENFLYHHHMAHNIMKVASFFVSPSNPRSVVVMVEENVRHKIPDYVLQVVDEDNIIGIPRFHGRLDYEAKEALRTRLV